VLVIDLYPLQGADEVSGEVVVVKSISYIPLLMVLEQDRILLHGCVCKKWRTISKRI
jgi:hypothetical protein